MSKKGVYKIEGNTSPKIGEKTVFKVVEWYPATPLSDRVQSKVTWELFIKENGKFRPANLKKPIGEFTFGTNADKFTYRVEGYLHSPEGKEPMSIIVQPQKNENPKPTAKKEILGVSLTYQDGSKITKTLNYQDKLRATAKCQALEGEHIVFCLWEDDEKNSGHNKKNQFIEKSPIIQVDSKGYARWNFTLLKTFISLAQKREDEDKKHEYYVTAEYNGKILNNSGNVNVNNPEPRIKITPKSSSSGPKPKTPPTVNKPKPQPDSPKGSTHQGSKNNQPDKKGVITNIKLTDLKGNAFKKRPKFGERIQLVIEGKNIKGRSYRLKIWEDDTTGKNDLLYNREHKFNGDKQIVYIDLTEDMQRVGEIGNNPKEPDSGEYWTGNYQEIYAEVILQNITTKSQIIDVDIKAEAKKTQNTRTASNVGKTETTKSSSTCVCKENQFRWGNKLSCDERKKVLQVCAELWGEENKKQKASELMSVMHLETNKTFNPAADNGAGYSGLIQFSDASAASVNTTRSALKKMTFIQQMDYVKAYFLKKKNSLITMTDLYLLVLKQNAVGQGNNRDHILFDESVSVPNAPYNKDNLSKEPWVTKYGYSSNPPFMREKGEWQNKRMFQSYSKGLIERRGFPNGKTYVWEVTDKLTKEHYNLGVGEIFNGTCQNIPQEKKKTTGKRAPWMDVAINIAKEMKGCTEDKDPMYTKAKSYLRYCGNSFEPTDGENGPWCAAFMNWTIGQVSYSHAKSAASLAPLDAVAGKKYKQITKPIYGCIVVYKHNKKWKGHTGFLYGMTKSGRYILIGGNQDNTIRFDDYGEYTSNTKTKKLYGFYIPIDYEVKDVDYLTDNDTYATSNEINVKYGIVGGKSTGKTN